MVPGAINSLREKIVGGELTVEAFCVSITFASLITSVSQRPGQAALHVALHRPMASVDESEVTPAAGRVRSCWFCLVQSCCGMRALFL